MTSNTGGTIQKALDFAMTQNPGKDTTSELYPNIAAVAAIYGDSHGRYLTFLSDIEPTYPSKPYFLWNQPFSDNGWVDNNPNYAGNTGSSNNVPSANNGNRGGGISVVAATASLATLSILALWLLA